MHVDELVIVVTVLSYAAEAASNLVLFGARAVQLQLVSNIELYPAVRLLAAIPFTGAALLDNQLALAFYQPDTVAIVAALVEATRRAIAYEVCFILD